MKIQGTNNWVSQMSYTKKSRTSDDSFGNLLKDHAVSESSDQNNVAQSHHTSNTDRIDYAKQRMFSNVNSIKFAGFRELTNDAFTDAGAQILQEVESLCSDETGESIDIKLLHELLELYEGTRQ